MRTVRTASVAAATALSLTLGGMTFAGTANAVEPATAIGEPGQAVDDGPVLFEGELEGDKSFGEVISDGTEGLFNGQGSSKYFNDTDKLFYGVDAFGEETNAANVPPVGPLLD